ncbi:MAG: DUF2520 domain-containing protein [Saprospiraceae bacterium]
MPSVKPKKFPKIILVGSGNVATYLGKAIMNTPGFRIIQVFSPTIVNAKRLGQKLSVPFTNKWTEIYPDADIFILAVNDDVIPECVKTLRTLIHKNALILHTSGSVSTDVFKSYFKYFGVIYPLQTFSIKKKSVAVSIPILITVQGRNTMAIVKQLAGSMSNDVRVVSDKTRLLIHLAAVMVNNFPNYWYVMAAQLLKSKKIEFEILLPLIEETTSKLKYLTPVDAQTGPAKRHDHKVIQLHEKILMDTFPEWKSAYHAMTTLIENHYK